MTIMYIFWKPNILIFFFTLKLVLLYNKVAQLLYYTEYKKGSIYEKFEEISKYEFNSRGFTFNKYYYPVSN